MICEICALVCVSSVCGLEKWGGVTMMGRLWRGFCAYILYSRVDKKTMERVDIMGSHFSPHIFFTPPFAISLVFLVWVSMLLWLVGSTLGVLAIAILV